MSELREQSFCWDDLVLTETVASKNEGGADPHDNEFVPNDGRYKCCCRTIHTVTGMRVLAVLLCVTALFELWHFGVRAYSAAQGENSEMKMAFFQFMVGLLIAASVITALWKEKAVFLVPYMLLQVAGLAAAAVFFVSFVFIALFGESDTAMAFLDGHGFVFSPHHKHHPQYINYASWMMVGTCAAVTAVQFWLITIVFRCWRFFRDKREWMRKCHTGYGECRYYPPKPRMNVKRVEHQPVPSLHISISADAGFMNSSPSHSTRAPSSNKTFSTSLDAIDLRS